MSDSLFDWCLDELCKVKLMLEKSNEINVELSEKLRQQTAELVDVEAAAAVAESVKHDEIDRERRQCAEEVATLHQLMDGLLAFSAAFICATFTLLV